MPQDAVDGYDVPTVIFQRPVCGSGGKRQSLVDRQRRRAKRTAGRTDDAVLLMGRLVAPLTIRLVVLEWRAHRERKILRK